MSPHEYNAKDDSPSSQNNFDRIPDGHRFRRVRADSRGANAHRNAAASADEHIHTSNCDADANANAARMSQPARADRGGHADDDFARAAVFDLSAALL